MNLQPLGALVDGVLRLVDLPHVEKPNRPGATLLDWAKRMDPEGKTTGIVALLSETNELLNDVAWLPAWQPKEAAAVVYRAKRIRACRRCSSPFTQHHRSQLYCLEAECRSARRAEWQQHYNLSTRGVTRRRRYRARRGF